MLSGLYALRMLGLFMVLPVMMLYGADLTGATAFLLGLALGAYGLTQACLQIPLGLLSDRFGRKPILALGLGLFCLGSVVAALADHVLVLIIGRALQGAGAISGVALALLADLTRESVRPRALAVVGGCIGLSFGLAMILGPWLAAWQGLSAIFTVTAILTLALLPLVLWGLPTPVHAMVHRQQSLIPAELRATLAHGRLWLLNLSVFCLHALIMAVFVAAPLVLQRLGSAPQQHASIYASVVVLGFIGMLPLMRLARRSPVWHQRSLLCAWLCLSLGALALISLIHSLTGAMVALSVFFVGFNYMEATLPAQMSSAAKAGTRGTALSIYSTCQFLGAACGGALAGASYQTWGLIGLAVWVALILIIWLVLLCSMPLTDAQLKGLSLATCAIDDTQAQQLVAQITQLPGVVDVLIIVEERMAYLKIDPRHINVEQVRSLLLPPSGG